MTENKYQHITKYETILNEFDEKTNELADLLTFFKDHHQDFLALMDYYYSDERRTDLKEDDEGKIPEDLPRGVLSEDAIYDLYSDYRSVSLQMLELGTQFFKGN